MTTTEELLNAVGLTRVRQPSTPSWVAPAAMLGAGVAIGAVAAALLTPKSGSQMRRDIADTATGLKDSATDAASRALPDRWMGTNHAGLVDRTLPAGEPIEARQTPQFSGAIFDNRYEC